MIRFVWCNFTLTFAITRNWTLKIYKKWRKHKLFIQIEVTCITSVYLFIHIWQVYGGISYLFLILDKYWHIIQKEMIWGHVAYFLFKYSKEVKVKVTSCSSSSSCFWFIFTGDSLFCFYATCSDCNHLVNFQTFIFFFLVLYIWMQCI